MGTQFAIDNALKQVDSEILKNKGFNMKYYYYIIVLLIFSLTNLQAHPHNFEKKLNEFRYSLHADLEPIPYFQMNKFEFSKQVIKKVENFLNNNKDEIKNYKTKVLEENQVKELKIPGLEYEEQKIDNKAFTVDISKIVGKEMNISMYRFMTINPYWGTILFSTAYLARTTGVETMAKYSIQNRFASTLYKTRKVDKDMWHIMVDQYSFIYMFSYNIETESLRLIKVYKRKSGK